MLQLRSNYSAPELWFRDNVPGALLLIRFYQFMLGELLYFLVFRNGASTRGVMAWVSCPNPDE